MERFARIWKDPVWSKVISWVITAIVGSVALAIAHIFDGMWDKIRGAAEKPLPLLSWQVWLWVVLTAALAGFSIVPRLRKRPTGHEAANSSLPSQQEQPPKIEIRTEPASPYQVTDVQAGQVQSTVKIGIRNAGGQTLSNCKVYIEKISPPLSPAGLSSLLLDGTGFQLRRDDPEKFVEVASHWDHHPQFRFSTPLSGAFFNEQLLMDGGSRRTFAIRVAAHECERSALLEIWADESKKLHLKFLNYLN